MHARERQVLRWAFFFLVVAVLAGAALVADALHVADVAGAFARIARVLLVGGIVAFIVFFISLRR